MTELKARLATCNDKPMIIGIAEVKPKNYRYALQTSEIQLPGYELFIRNLDNNVGRGIALYVHSSLQASPFNPATEDSVDSVS